MAEQNPQENLSFTNPFETDDLETETHSDLVDSSILDKSNGFFVNSANGDYLHFTENNVKIVHNKNVFSCERSKTIIMGEHCFTIALSNKPTLTCTI